MDEARSRGDARRGAGRSDRRRHRNKGVAGARHQRRKSRAGSREDGRANRAGRHGQQESEQSAAGKHQGTSRHAMEGSSTSRAEGTEASAPASSCRGDRSPSAEQGGIRGERGRGELKEQGGRGPSSAMGELGGRRSWARAREPHDERRAWLCSSARGRGSLLAVLEILAGREAEEAKEEITRAGDERREG
jgi:hypothetical protein|uniref:Uncharacterized protein n=1 Tax=Zea mays TaxID=4577 RepID=A0A804U7D6_MAIZE